MRSLVGALGVALLGVMALAAPVWAADGGSLYGQRCAGCHGPDGLGSGSFPALQGSALLTESEGLTTIITQGRGGMPAFGYLGEDEVDALVVYLQATWGTAGGDAEEDDSSAGVAGDPAVGATVYSAECAACHGPAGEGRGVYPPLGDDIVGSDRAALESLISMGRGGMPAFADLSPAEMAGLVAFLQSMGEAAPEGGTQGTESPTTSTTNPAPSGDATRGERLFTGADSFDEGGGACLACHAAGSHGAVSGGSLGTDLTDAFARYGSETAIAGVLEDPAFKVMRSAYADKPLSAQERADVAAYLAGLPPQTAAASVFTDRFWIFGLAGTIVLFAVMGVVATRRRPGLAQQLREARRQGRGA